MIGIVNVECGNPGKLRYEVVKEGRHAFYFKINSSTGELSLPEDVKLDANVLPLRQVRVRVTDAFNEVGEGYVFVKLTDKNQPPRIQDAAFTIDNYRDVGFVIGSVFAFDQDHDPLVFRIRSGNDKEIFSIDPSWGLLEIADTRGFPTESNVFDLEIEVSDGIAQPVIGKVKIEYNVLKSPFAN